MSTQVGEPIGCVHALNGDSNQSNQSQMVNDETVSPRHCLPEPTLDLTSLQLAGHRYMNPPRPLASGRVDRITDLQSFLVSKH